MIVAIEGLDGSGKSTVIRLLSDELRRRGVTHIVTSEPTKGPIGKLIKEYLLKSRERNYKIEALLFAADRLWHLENIIIPSAKQGKIVITDRYKYSSIAYQSINSEGEKWIRELNKFAPDADIAIFLDVDPETCLKRISNRKKSVMENLNNLRKVYSKYVELVERGELIKLDGKKEPSEIVKEIIALLEKEGIV